MTKLSVNVNKVATIRNARGGTLPDPLAFALAAENFGAQGITVHPRPDERHISKNDVLRMKKKVRTEFNIEGYPSNSFLELVQQVRPEQVTLVPDAPDVITSNAGWDCIKHQSLLKEIIHTIKDSGSRVSIFLDPDPAQVEAALSAGTDRIELYTEAYARGYSTDRKSAIKPYSETANEAAIQGVGVNAGHDLNLENLNYFIRNVKDVLEVSIGHALVSDCLYYGLNNTIQMYLKECQPSEHSTAQTPG